MQFYFFLSRLLIVFYHWLSTVVHYWIELVTFSPFSLSQEHFQSSLLAMMLAASFLENVPFQVEEVPFYSQFAMTNWQWILSNAFSSSIEMIVWLFISLLNSWIILIEFWMLKWPWIAETNCSWLWCIILFLCCWIQLVNILMRILGL